jgi:hypothetical protein
MYPLLILHPSGKKTFQLLPFGDNKRYIRKCYANKRSILQERKIEMYNYVVHTNRLELRISKSMNA